MHQHQHHVWNAHAIPGSPSSSRESTTSHICHMEHIIIQCFGPRRTCRKQISMFYHRTGLAATQLALGSRRRVNPPGIRLFLGSADNIHCDRVGELRLWSLTLTLFPLIIPKALKRKSNNLVKHFGKPSTHCFNLNFTAQRKLPQRKIRLVAASSQAASNSGESVPTLPSGLTIHGPRVLRSADVVITYLCTSGACATVKSGGGGQQVVFSRLQ